MRVSGLATGMDTENIIKNLMEAERIPLDKITHKKQQLEWKLEDYRDVNRDLKKMQYNLRDTVNRQSSYNAKSVTVSNPDAVGVKSINSTSDFSGTIAVHQLATNSTWQSDRITIPTDKTEKSTLAELGITGNKIKIQSGGEPVEVTFNSATDTLSSLVDKINKETTVNAFFDSQTGSFAFSAKNGGSDNNIVVGGDGDGNMMIGGNVVGGAGTVAQNAEITFNGLRTERGSNTFQINGFEFNLKQVTTNEVTFNSTADVDKIMDNVVKFVDDYNKLIEDLNGKIRASVHRNFHPLSDEQKKEMSDKEVELWEEKAKSGALKNDPTITSMLTKLRSIMNDEVGGVRLSDFGITPTKDYLSHGKLEIDEDKLRASIAEDPNRLYELIGKPGSATEKAGLSHQFRIEIENAQKDIGKRAGSTGAVNDSFTLGKNLKDMNSQIEKFENRLQMVESRLWKQFNAMESAIQRMNAQSANLMSQFGG